MSLIGAAFLLAACLAMAATASSGVREIMPRTSSARGLASLTRSPRTQAAVVRPPRSPSGTAPIAIPQKSPDYDYTTQDYAPAPPKVYSLRQYIETKTAERYEGASKTRFVGPRSGSIIAPSLVDLSNNVLGGGRLPDCGM